jgi:hypothetical protein
MIIAESLNERKSTDNTVPRVIGTRPIATVTRRRPRSKYIHLLAAIRGSTAQGCASQVVAHSAADRRNIIKGLRLLAARLGLKLVTRSAAADLNPYEFLCWVDAPKPRGSGS